MKSFNSLEKGLAKTLKEKLNRSENVADVRKDLEIIIFKLFENIFPENDFDTSRLIIDFESSKFDLSDELKENEAFMAIWNNSDLPDIIDRFFQEALHRYIHLKKNPEKTNLKIRNH